VNTNLVLISVPVGVFQLDNANNKCLVVNQSNYILCEACITQCSTQTITVSD